MKNINSDFVSADEVREFMKERNEVSKILERIHSEIIEAAKEERTKVVLPYHINSNDVDHARKLGKSVEVFLVNKGYEASIQYDPIGFSISIEW